MDSVQEAHQHSVNYRELLHALCKDKRGFWRRGCFGYLLIQARERTHLVEELNLEAMVEMKRILEVFYSAAISYPGDPRIETLLHAVAPCLKASSDLFEEKSERGELHRDREILLKETGEGIVSLYTLIKRGRV